ncbi:MAG: sodium:proton antiporter [Micavibrio aeruginosavorus]|uniref:Sodium:proton antiporter n=1 Tax=Micavibrio aeruginosavorus TaxID=349221 RepID=A0A2W5NBH8_9BACT|nr:MAG: sodium:proton antiporter [Micavibrio aeruginosavorus]
MTVFEIIAVILSVAAIGGYINYRYIGFPPTIGHMAFALLLSVLAIFAGSMGWFDLDAARAVVNSIDFSEVVLHGLLSYLLFAGALHIRLDDLKSVKWAVGSLATIGVVMATFLIGTLIWWAAQWMGLPMPYVYALLFGALISPTDPIAVLSILKEAGASKSLSTKVGGESLFNDGVGVVLFLAILSAANNPDHFEVSHVLLAFVEEGMGGLLLGGVLGWITYCLLRSIDDYKVEVLLTIALVTGGYALAEALHISAPLCMVAAGLIIGNQGRAHGMSDTTRQHIDVFWELVDEVLNAVLFLLIGLEILIVTLSSHTVQLGLIAIPIVLLARFVSVGLPVTVMRFFQAFDKGTVRLLTWGGLRGGLSIAMALSLPAGPEKPVILTMTYIVVLFSIFVQGLTFKRSIAYIMKR